MALGVQFKIGLYAQKMSESVLREARADFDLLMKQKPEDANGKRNAQSTWDGGDYKRVKHIVVKNDHDVVFFITPTGS